MDENKKLSKNMIEKESSSGGRLQSLKIRRDLSLGITKPKKQYAPNLNVVRNKDKTKEFLKKIDQKRKEKNANRDRFQNKNDKLSRFVQSAGVFSQGSGEVKRLTSTTLEKRVHVRESSGGGGGGATIEKPTIKKETWIVDKSEEDLVLDELTNCDIDSDEEKLAFVPLTLSTNNRKQTFIKKELCEFDSEELSGSTVPPPFNNNEAFSEENPALALVKLPDSFAGKGLSDDPNVKKLFDYPLNGMLEGQIGKLLIRKSGRMEVQIGRVQYELRPENTFESIEQLAVINKNPNNNEDNHNKHDIAILGNVLNNFVMFPDYDAILKR